MTKIEQIIAYLEYAAPLSFQEKYDNSGLIIGDASKVVDRMLICLDVTDAILDEAKDKGCNLIIAHHPIIFKPINKLTGNTCAERCIIKAIKNSIAIYAMHTNLDNIGKGVSHHLAESIGLVNIRLLLPKRRMTYKLTTFVPHQAASYVRKVLHQVGAKYCNELTINHNFTSRGANFFNIGHLRSGNPMTQGGTRLEHIEEEKIEITFPKHLEEKVLKELHNTHPYENAPYQIQQLENTIGDVGVGALGELRLPLASRYFLKYIKTKLGIMEIAHTAYIKNNIIKVAVCGGAGSFLIQEAINQNADAFITADLKYHDFFKADGRILFGDIGHYNSEIGTKDLIYTILSKKFDNIVILRCETVTNPVYHI